MQDVEDEPLFAEWVAGIDIAKAGIEVIICLPSDTRRAPPRAGRRPHRGHQPRAPRGRTPGLRRVERIGERLRAGAGALDQLDPQTVGARRIAARTLVRS